MWMTARQEVRGEDGAIGLPPAATPRRGRRRRRGERRRRGRRAVARPARERGAAAAVVVVAEARRGERDPGRGEQGERTAMAAASPWPRRCSVRRQPAGSRRRHRRASAPRRIGCSTKCHDSPATTSVAATWSAARQRSVWCARRGRRQHEDRHVPEIDAVGAHADPAQRSDAEHAAQPAGGVHERGEHEDRGERQQHEPAAVEERRVLVCAPDQHGRPRPGRRRRRGRAGAASPRATVAFSRALGQTIASAAPASSSNARVSVPK